MGAKTCRSCRHIRLSIGQGREPLCCRPTAVFFDPVDGNQQAVLGKKCRSERTWRRELFTRRRMCGPDAIYWEQHQEEVPPKSGSCVMKIGG